MSEQLPPPPIFKPKFAFTVNNSATVGQIKKNNKLNSNCSNSNNNNNSNFLTSSFVSNKEYQNAFLKHSPSISPMLSSNDTPINESDRDLDLNSPSPKLQKAKKRKRNSSINSSEEEIARKKKELKSQHSIIEKRRRIKMNREFEALKFMVPACRLQILQGLGDNNNFENSNMMHKLTILQSTVEYIKYLHLIIKLMKLQMLIPKDTREGFKKWFNKNNNLDFVNFDLDLQSYRDLENDFDFEEQFLKIADHNGNIPNECLDPITIETNKLMKASDSSANLISKQRSFSYSEIQDSPSLLSGKIQEENTHYKRCIFQLQNDSKSFKLPLPAIIEKHPNLLFNSDNNYTNLPENNYTHTHNYTQHSRPKSVIPNYPVPIASLKKHLNHMSKPTATTSMINPSVYKTTTKSVSEPTSNQDVNYASADIRVASQLLVQFKSDVASQMSPAIANPLSSSASSSASASASASSSASASPPPPPPLTSTPTRKKHPTIRNILN